MQQAGLLPASDVQAVFREVLEEPDFAYAGTPPLVRALRAVVQWVQDLLGRWFPVLGDSEARVLSWVLMGLCAAFALYLLSQRLGSRTGRRRPRVASESPGAAEPRDAEQWIAWARDAARAGRLRHAATGLYQSTILTLDARGALRYREWKTPGDYALEVSGHDLRRPFLDFLGRFMEIAFGPGDPTPEAYESLAAGAARLGGRV